MNETMTPPFEQPGTFPTPGPIGRIIRLVLGIVMLDTAVFRAYSGVPEFSAVTTDPTFWFVAVLSLFFLRDMIDGGFSLSWGRWAQAAVLVLAVAAIGVDLVWSRSVWNPAFGMLVSWLIVVVFGYFGLNFILQGLFATPGCEARALPHLIGRLSGREMAEYRCLVFGPLDEWEATLSSGHKPERETPPARERDK